ncbi:MAG: tRNA uridine-5-carboxymethylaminomethyl(34) synthesis GTPase MnmE [Amoebophilaceae bacterium]|nr:tRNA uridine-5-carboxymethylaminomethyl(34) synthesis GTPase MnmE [Amoebophilaceae bacterium]
MYQKEDPIIALATPLGVGAIAVIRLSGKNIISIVNQVFHGKDLTKQPSHTLHFGVIQKGDRLIDEVLVSLFIAPHSFTKEDAVEISCHGSPFIIEQLIQLFIEQGVRMAEAGEFTKRAFLNGRFDLAQAEAVADLIAAESTLAHQTALHQMRGGFSLQLKALRSELVHFAAMLALELDFAEEAVEFLDRTALSQLVDKLILTLHDLVESFRLGNVIKHGISVVIVGKPNTGKSTLLNQLLEEERAIVSPIAGTTRDVIEGQLHLAGILFRFMDTAGLREAVSDEIEAIGMERTKQQVKKSTLMLYMVDLTEATFLAAEDALKKLNPQGIALLKIGNKRDLATSTTIASFSNSDYLLLSAQDKTDIALLNSKLVEWVQQQKIQTTGAVVVNARHYDRLQQSKQALEEVKLGITQQLTNELLVVDIHSACYALGEITGEITTEELLGEIFSKFCIGK